MLVHHSATSPIAGTHLYTWVMERGTVRVKCLFQEHNTMSPAQPGLEPRLLDHETRALTMRPPFLLSNKYNVNEGIFCCITSGLIVLRGLVCHLSFLFCCLEYGPRPAALGRTRDLGHSFSQYGPPGQ